MNTSQLIEREILKGNIERIGRFVTGSYASPSDLSAVTGLHADIFRKIFNQKEDLHPSEIEQIGKAFSLEGNQILSPDLDLSFIRIGSHMQEQTEETKMDIENSFEKLKNRFVFFKKSTGLTQAAIARKGGVSKGLVNQYFNGSVSNLKLSLALKICKGTSFNPAWLCLGSHAIGSPYLPDEPGAHSEIQDTPTPNELGILLTQRKTNPQNLVRTNGPTNPKEFEVISPLLAGIFDRLPPEGSLWEKKEREKWMKALEASLDLIYKDTA